MRTVALAANKALAAKNHGLRADNRKLDSETSVRGSG
jgi:hypothetical protein